MPVIPSFSINGIHINPPPGIPTCPPAPQSCVGHYFQFFFTYFLLVIIFSSLFFIIWGGIKWIMSKGETDKLASARLTITFALVGLVLALLSFAIVKLIGTIFGVSLI